MGVVLSIQFARMCEKRKEKQVDATFFILFIFLLFESTCTYVNEKNAQIWVDFSQHHANIQN